MLTTKRVTYLLVPLSAFSFLLFYYENEKTKRSNPPFESQTNQSLIYENGKVLTGGQKKEAGEVYNYTDRNIPKPTPLKSYFDLDPKAVTEFNDVVESCTSKLLELELSHYRAELIDKDMVKVTIPPVFEKGGRELLHALKADLADKFGEDNVPILLASVTRRIGGNQTAGDFGKTPRHIVFDLSQISDEETIAATILTANNTIDYYDHIDALPTFVRAYAEIAKSIN